MYGDKILGIAQNLQNKPLIERSNYDYSNN